MAYTTIDKPSDYFETVLYTGNGGTNSISSLDFQPDWLWIKCRSDANGSNIFDALRGTNSLHSDTSGAEADRASDGFTSLDNDGFTLNGSGSGGSINVSSRTYAAWNWLAGGTASSNSNGSITSSVSANTTAGFSIVSYTGTGSNATVGHGLGVAPKMMIFKNRSAAQPWCVYHDGLSSSSYSLHLDETSAEQNLSPNPFNSSAPTSTLINLGGQDMVNKSSDNHIAYCFAEKKGYSKFGSYTGNGSLDAPFIYTGMKVSWLMIKRTDTTNSWVMFDNKRNAFNVVDKHLFANTNDPEDSSANYNEVDFLSNGFKLREDNNTINASGGTYIYMAFAENPFVTSSGVPACAR